MLFKLGSNSTTPQGDGNTNDNPKNTQNAKFKFHYPARGRKREERCSKQHSVAFKFHYPARGRKPLVIHCGNEEIAEFKFHYPARGRKLSLTPFPPVLAKNVQIPLPRKGTETDVFYRNLARYLVQIPLPRKGTETIVFFYRIKQHARSNSTTPQGDGNVISSLTTSSKRRFKFHYPARGRKLVRDVVFATC